MVVAVVVKGISYHREDFAFARLGSVVREFKKEVKKWGGEPKLLTSQNMHQNDPMDEKVLVLANFIQNLSNDVNCVFVIQGINN